jgi:hypothetical protein
MCIVYTWIEEYYMTIPFAAPPYTYRRGGWEKIKKEIEGRGANNKVSH